MLWIARQQPEVGPQSQFIGVELDSSQACSSSRLVVGPRGDRRSEVLAELDGIMRKGQLACG